MPHPRRPGREFASTALAACLKNLGFKTGRLKTGTPPCLAAGSIDFAGMEVLNGDPRPRPFSWRTTRLPQEQMSCFVTHTTGATHKLIRDHLHLSPLYSGVIKGVSARYRPSLEDKVMRFPEKISHQVTLEPGGGTPAKSMPRAWELPAGGRLNWPCSGASRACRRWK